jgi:Response regulators consisting of a CheY-like receiver domain and a winged-helix DNA-binding domain
VSLMPKILLVEDNEMNRDMLSRRLIRNGFEVVVAVDGGQAVTMAAAENPDLILMDMSLPVMDGLEATRQVKAAPGTRAIPIIALTANALVEDREKALAAGCDDFDTKPVELPGSWKRSRISWGKRSAALKVNLPGRLPDCMPSCSCRHISPCSALLQAIDRGCGFPGVF